MSLSSDISNRDIVVLPSWIPGHWLLCIIKPKEREIYFLDPVDKGAFGQYIDTYRKIAKYIHKDEWTERTMDSFERIPKQTGDTDCGLFILMYTMYIALGLQFDFEQDDMPMIRKWWCALLIDNFSLEITHKRQTAAPRLSKRQRLEKFSDTGHKVETTLYQLPPEILTKILKDVILSDGETAYRTLSLVCREFRDVIGNDAFRREVHFSWLDGVVNWSIFSSQYRDEYRKAYRITECLNCKSLYKDCPPGYRGRGKRGELLGFYSVLDYTGFCSQDCFFEIGGTQ
ncbi:uncharacterized protein [Paramormyrops kingsleyae]|uniref:uncharacterized protein n=1 Tax=Paramormyrops kingsleyae TaxID=1676925 RepID=UPI003B975807